MAYGDPERFYGLPGKGAPAGIGNRARDHDRHAQPAFFEELFDGEEGCFCVQGIKNRFDQQDFRASVE